MKQIYRKKPEYLNVVFVKDDTESIKDVYELVGASKANIIFDDNGNRVIVLEDGLQIPVGNVVFTEKKSGKVVTMPEEKLLQFYDVSEDKGDE